MDDPEAMWDSLALSSLVPLSSATPPPTPRSSALPSPRSDAGMPPPCPPSPPPPPPPPHDLPEAWWTRRAPPSPVLQVRLDGSPADVPPFDIIVPAFAPPLAPPRSTAAGADAGVSAAARVSPAPHTPVSSPPPPLPHSHSHSHSHSPPHAHAQLHAPSPPHVSACFAPARHAELSLGSPPRGDAPVGASPRAPASPSSTSPRAPVSPAHAHAHAPHVKHELVVPAPVKLELVVSSPLSPHPAPPLSPLRAHAAAASYLPLGVGAAPPSPQHAAVASAANGAAPAASRKSPVRARPRSAPSASGSVSSPAASLAAGPALASPIHKERRAREPRFPKDALKNLDGTTSAEVRKMNATERELVLYKRKLRNRESARRSRQKRQATLADLQDELEDLLQVSHRMVDVGLALRAENTRLKDRLELADAEIRGLRAGYTGAHDVSSGAAASGEKGSAGEEHAAMKMKLGG